MFFAAGYIGIHRFLGASSLTEADSHTATAMPSERMSPCDSKLIYCSNLIGDLMQLPKTRDVVGQRLVDGCDALPSMVVLWSLDWIYSRAKSHSARNA